MLYIYVSSCFTIIYHIRSCWRVLGVLGASWSMLRASWTVLDRVEIVLGRVGISFGVILESRWDLVGIIFESILRTY